VPESKKRKKADGRPVDGAARPARSTPKKKGPSPRWLAPLMLACFGIGILWLVVFYVAQDNMPLVSDLGNGNLAVGFGFIVVGFGLSTQWR
jgi:hypothetical protein